MATPTPSPLPPSPMPPGPTGQEKEDSVNLWYVGAIINVVGSISINLGMNLMKLGHTRREQLDMPDEEKPPIRKFKVWAIGISIFTTGNVLNFVSFAFAAQSLLAALGSLQLVCNVFFAYLVNKEPVTKIILLSTLCIIAGCVLLVVFGNQSSETYTVKELIKFYTLAPYVIYIIAMMIIVFSSYIIYLNVKKYCRKSSKTSGFLYSVMLVSYSVFSALLGSHSVLFGKSMSVILRAVIQGDVKQLASWYTWVVLPCFIVAAIFWVTRLNKGLRMFPAMLIVPLMQIAWTLFSIVEGMIYFQEYKEFTTLKYIMFPVGVLIVFSGVMLLTASGSGSQPPEELAACEEVENTPASRMTVHENAAFAAKPAEGGDQPSPMNESIPPAKSRLGQTLRFTSTWTPASMAALSPGSNNRTLAHGESLRRQRRMTETSDLNATGRTYEQVGGALSMGPLAGGDKPTFANLRDHEMRMAANTGAAAGPGLSPHINSMERNSTLNRTAPSVTSRVSETPSMLNAMRKGLKGMQTRLTSDLGLETKEGFKLAMGIGDSNKNRLTAVSLFAMPALDFTSTTKRPSRSGVSNEQLLASLPRSKFYRAPDHEGLTTIQETSGRPTTKAAGSDLAGSVHLSGNTRSQTSSSQLRPSSREHSSPPAGSPNGGRMPQSPRGMASASPPTTSGHGMVPPLDHASLMNMLPGPSFRPSGMPPGSGVSGAATPSAAPAGAPGSSRPSGSGYRRPVGQPPEGQVLLPGFGPQGTPFGYGHGPGPGPPAAGERFGSVLEVPGGSGRPLAKPGSLGTLLPDGVPLSSANSMIFHESRPGTPPDVMLGGGGSMQYIAGVGMAVAGGGGGRTSSPTLYPAASQHGSGGGAAPYIQPTLLHRAHLPPLANPRMPPAHLVMPGIAAGAAPLVQYGGPAPSASYAQMLSGQVAPDGALLAVLSSPQRAALAYANAVAYVGNVQYGGGSPMHGAMSYVHPQAGVGSPMYGSPSGPSVSRSWAGIAGGPPGSAGRRGSPLRGSMLGPMQRPLRPWQQY